jgi:hypothetical protein
MAWERQVCACPSGEWRGEESRLQWEEWAAVVIEEEEVWVQYSRSLSLQLQYSLHELQAFGPGCAFTPTSKSAVSAAKERQSAELSIFLRNSVSRVDSFSLGPTSQTPRQTPTSKPQHRHSTQHNPLHLPSHHHPSLPRSAPSLITTHPASPLSPSAHAVAQRAAGVGNHDVRAPRQGTAGSVPSVWL